MRIKSTLLTLIVFTSLTLHSAYAKNASVSPAALSFRPEIKKMIDVKQLAELLSDMSGADRLVIIDADFGIQINPVTDSELLDHSLLKFKFLFRLKEQTKMAQCEFDVIQKKLMVNLSQMGKGFRSLGCNYFSFDAKNVPVKIAADQVPFSNVQLRELALLSEAKASH